MNRKLIVLALAAGFATGAWAQVPVTLVVDGVTDPRILLLESLAVTPGQVTLSVTTDGGTPPPTGDITRTLTVTTPTNGQIIDNGTGQPVTGVTSYTFPPETPPTVSLSLSPSTGYLAGSWGGSCSSVLPTQNCVLSMSQNRTVSATFTADTPPEGECGATPPNVTIVQTTASALRYGKVTVAANNTSKDTIHAYRFTTLAGGTEGRSFITRWSGGEGKFGVITKCPGDIVNPIATRGCAAYSTESTALYYAVKPTSRDWRIYCHVEPAKTYYLNVVHRSSFTAPPTCTTNCGFNFEIE